VSKALDQILDAIEQSEGRRQRKRVVQNEDGLSLLSPSACDGCDRANVYKILGTEPTNTTDGLPAWMGTTIHEAAEEALRELDPFGDTYLLEQRLPGIAELGLADGNSDIIVVDEANLVDLKTVKKRDKRYFPSVGKIRQVMLYGGMARKANIDIETVEIIGLCRDGNKQDIQVWGPEPWSEEIASEALDYLGEMRERAVAYRQGDERALPRPDRPAKTFCAVYCDFYGRCEGK
jgi:hypothetical protein